MTSKACYIEFISMGMSFSQFYRSCYIARFHSSSNSRNAVNLTLAFRSYAQRFFAWMPRSFRARQQTQVATAAKYYFSTMFPILLVTLYAFSFSFLIRTTSDAHSWYSGKQETLLHFCFIKMKKKCLVILTLPQIFVYLAMKVTCATSTADMHYKKKVLHVCYEQNSNAMLVHMHIGIFIALFHTSDALFCHSIRFGFQVESFSP